jgi:hypothetical protein
MAPVGSVQNLSTERIRKGLSMICHADVTKIDLSRNRHPDQWSNWSRFLVYRYALVLLRVHDAAREP